MLFGRVKTPKGIETIPFFCFKFSVVFGRVKTPKGIETIRRESEAIIWYWFGRVKTPKGIETLKPLSFTIACGRFGRVKTPKGIETFACASVVYRMCVWKSKNPKGD